MHKIYVHKFHILLNLCSYLTFKTIVEILSLKDEFYQYKSKIMYFYFVLLLKKQSDYIILIILIKILLLSKNLITHKV